MIAVLPDSPVLADLDAAYAVRGQQIALCDGARALAVETLEAERRMNDEWLARLRRPDPG